MNDEKIAALRLFRTRNIGPVAYMELISIYGTASETLNHVSELAARGGGNNKPYSIAEAKKELEKLTNIGGNLVTIHETAYPKPLREIHDPPPVLSVLGNPKRLKDRQLGVVGARNASLHATKFAKSICQDIGDTGFTITSGLARGIDTAAHEGSIKTGTVAVLGGGVDYIYPKENRGLYENIIAENGAIISEMKIGLSPRPEMFPRRNRIISGLSLGVLVVEATKNSGSLITARFANEQGREVFAIPGFPVDARSGGPNQLIKNGAQLVESAKDVVKSLKELHAITAKRMEEEHDEYLAPSRKAVTETALAPVRGDIISQLSTVAVSVDEIIEVTSIPTNMVQIILLELELAGRLQRHPGNRVSLIDG